MTTSEFALPSVNSFSSPYFFFSNDVNQQILYVSPSVEHILGFHPSEIIGKKYTEFLDVHSPFNNDIPQCQQRRFQGDGVQYGLRVVQTKDREIKVLKVQTHGVTDDQGRTVANHAIAQDVTNIYFNELKMHLRLEELRAVDAKLSNREKDVLQRVKSGQLNKVIAKELQLSERAVEGVRSRLMKKFKAETIAVVVTKATELDMLNDVILLAHQPSESRSRLEFDRLPCQAC